LTLDEDFVDEIESIDVAVDGTKLGSRPTAQWNGNRVAVEEWTVEPGAGRVEVRIAGPTAETAVFADEVELAPNQQLQIVVRSQSLAPVADDGRKIFLARQSGCSVCHSVEQGEDLVGPSLYGVATRAETRVEGLDARTYLWQSILLPDEYVVDGYPAGQMLPIYRERLSQEELDALIAYMLTLTEEIADSEGGDS
jgi:mono/diheme cytochrome c family protein